MTPEERREAGLEKFVDARGEVRWTHPDGDEVAARILDGTIPFEVACEQAATRRRHGAAIVHALQQGHMRSN